MLTGAVANVSDTLDIHIDRNEPDPIEAPTTFAATHDFALEITNGGEPVHVHLSCDDDVGGAIEFETGNHYVQREGAYRVPVEIVATDRPVRGRIQVSVGYGADTAYTELRITEPTGKDLVQVDESLSRPPEERPSPAAAETAIDFTTVVAVGAVTVSIVAAVALLAYYVDPIIGVVAAVIVIAAAAALYLLREFG